MFQPYICEGSDRRGGSGADLNHVSSPVRTPWERHRLLQLQPAIQNRPTNTQNVGQHPQRSTKLSHVATEIPTGKCLKCVVFRVFFTHLPAGANFSRYQKFLMWVYPDFFWLAYYVIFFTYLRFFEEKWWKTSQNTVGQYFFNSNWYPPHAFRLVRPTYWLLLSRWACGKAQ